jgi:hypothetical protein
VGQKNLRSVGGVEIGWFVVILSSWKRKAEICRERSFLAFPVFTFFHNDSVPLLVALLSVAGAHSVVVTLLPLRPPMAER